MRQMTVIPPQSFPSLRPLIAWILLLAPLLGATVASRAAERQVDPSTLRHKTLVGYQGWFRCPGDGTTDGWKHWSRDRAKVTPDTLTFEMWPDLSEYDADEKYAAPGFTLPGGGPAHLFSSANPKTVRRHFRWMQEHVIDGVFLQRFLVELRNPSTDKVLENVRAAAAESGRVYALCYDLSGARPDRLVDQLAADWKRLVDETGVTRDANYLRHDGRPVLFVWGFYPDRFGADVAHRLIDFFKSDGPYRVTLVGGCPWHWRGERDAEWSRAFRRLDVISPWNVGNAAEIHGEKHAATAYWKDDLAEARRAGMEYLPVIYPGFGWTNLKGARAANQTLPRLGGKFFSRQFDAAADLGVDMVYVAMFDEVDEATAVFKVTNTPPTQAKFQTYERLPPDHYLRLTGEGAKRIRGERKDEHRSAAPVER
jgi:hypothetical protein